jgi:hypothetical protein
MLTKQITAIQQDNSGFPTQMLGGGENKAANKHELHPQKLWWSNTQSFPGTRTNTAECVHLG